MASGGIRDATRHDIELCLCLTAILPRNQPFIITSAARGSWGLHGSRAAGAVAVAAGRWRGRARAAAACRRVTAAAAARACQAPKAGTG